MEDEKTIYTEETIKSELSSDPITEEVLKEDELDQVSGGSRPGLYRRNNKG